MRLKNGAGSKAGGVIQSTITLELVVDGERMVDMAHTTGRYQLVQGRECYHGNSVETQSHIKYQCVGRN